MKSKLGRSLLALAVLAPALAAENVTTVLKGTSLTIKGSAGADDVTITNAVDLGDGDGPSPVDVLVTPNKGTTLNGSTDPATFPGVLKLKIVLGAGSDVLDMTDFDFGVNPVTLNAGPGDDHVTLTNATTGTFKFIGAAGDDIFELQSCHLEATKVISSSGILTMPATSTYFHDLTLKGGPEADELTWTDVTVDFNFKPNYGGGNDVIAMNACTVGSATTIKLGGGNDHFTDDGGNYGEFVTVVAGGGDDEVDFEDSTIGNGLTAKLGAGQNQLSLVAQDFSMVVGNTAVITGGGQLDSVELRAIAGHPLIIGNDLILALKAGTNDVEAVGDVSTGNDFFYTGGGADDTVDLNATDIGNDANIALAAGSNAAVLTNCSVGNDLHITAGNGDDTVQLSGNTIGGLTLINLGGGNNIGP